MVWCVMWTMALLAVSVDAAVHKVGDCCGWTTLIPVDYAKWASSHSFHVGDSLLFSYNNKFHNVLQVNQQQYGSCNSSSPAASYNSGRLHRLKRTGTFYFLCGIPAMSQEGQKVEIKVTRASSSAVIALSPAQAQAQAQSHSPMGLRWPHSKPPQLSTTCRCLLLAGAFVVAFYHLYV